MELKIAPGESDDAGLNEIWEQQKSKQNPDYWEFGLYVIKKIREESSPNKDTPIIVFTVYKAINDSLFPNAEKTTLKAGATQYISMTTEPQKFLDSIKSYLERN